MTVIDLTQARQQREALRQAVEDAATGISGELTAMAMRFADWSFAVAGPLAARDPEMAKIVYRGVRRLLLCQVRRETPTQIRSVALELARQTYRGRLIALIDERDGRGGGAA